MSEAADIFYQTNLVSDVPGLAQNMDLSLRNPWGVAFSPTSPFWISNQGSGTSTLYDGAGNKIPLTVSIPGSSTPPSGPTGQVFAGGSGFTLSNGSAASFIFDTLNGTIDGWNGAAGMTAIQMSSTKGAIYTGLALANSGGSNYLYAADSTGQIRVFNTSFHATSLAGNFTDPNAIAGYAPFNIQAIGSQLYVTYAELTAQGVAAPGSNGYIDVFNTDGDFVKRFATGGSLFAPWGVTLAPAGFGSFGNDLLVGNFGNGEILAYDPTTGLSLGTLDGPNGQPIVNDYLWSLDFRTGGANTNPDTLYFTAGINNQADGLFGALSPTSPEPSAVTLALVGLGALTLVSKRVRGRRNLA
jgi:uncharacterized protein (TIGR03118 family)